MTQPKPAYQRIAIPCFEREVAPRFEAARLVRRWVVDHGELGQPKDFPIDEEGGIPRARLLRNLQTDVLICNGIQESFRQMLEGSGCRVIHGVAGPIGRALDDFLAGKFSAEKPEPVEGSGESADTLPWALGLFTELGWEVERVTESRLYPIDLIARMDCPKCGRPIRVAVCCGGHDYRMEEELREFQRVTVGSFDARVYVREPMGELASNCADYEIELLAPSSFPGGRVRTLNPEAFTLPPLAGRIQDHENLQPDPTI